MDGNIDAVREALERLRGFTHHAADSQDSEDIKTVCSALSTIGNEASSPSEDTEKLCHQIYDVLPISPALKLLDDGKLYALITAHDEAIRRECADRARRYLDGLPYYEGGYTNGLHAAILGAGPAQDAEKPPCA